MPEVRLLPLCAADRPLYPEMPEESFAQMLEASVQQQYQGRFYQEFVIWQGDQPAGRVSLLGKTDDSASEGIEVFPVYRRQGVATRALSLLMDVAAQAGFRTLTAQVRTDNEASLALHGKVGFLILRTYMNRRGREVHDLACPLKGTPMHHEMSLRPGPFAAIASGRKRYELRLNDEKRQRIHPGDTITFTNLADGTQVRTRVIALHPFLDFAALYASLPLLECGYTEEDVASADPQDMVCYYPPEKQAQYGVVGIELELVSSCE